LRGELATRRRGLGAPGAGYRRGRGGRLRGRRRRGCRGRGELLAGRVGGGELVLAMEGDGRVRRCLALRRRRDRATEGGRLSRGRGGTLDGRPGGGGVLAVRRRRAVDRDRAAARDRGGRGGDRRQLAGRGGLRRGLELERGRRGALVDAAGDRLVQAHEEAVSRLGRGRRERHREERRQRRRRRVQLAHRRATRPAVAQVRAHLQQLLRRRLAIDDRRQHRQPALAFAAAVD